MNILIIATGGTIGSDFDGGSINVRTDGGCAVIDRYQEEHSEIDFDIIHPLNILSERISAADFNALAQSVYNADIFRYDGIIFTVGSDNLGYIASFVGLICAGFETPVMMVCANKILSAPDSNGYVNFCCAVELIRQKKRGVYVPYRNGDGVMYVHSATDIRQADLSEDFYSFHGAYATCENGVLQENRAYVNQTIPDVFDKERPPVIGDSVLLLHPYPMLDYSAVRACGKKAVLHTLYHSATLDSGAAARFIDSLGGVPFYLASLRSGRQIYASTAEIISAGAMPLYDISPECAYMKLLLACAQDKLTISEFMEAGI